MVKSLFARLFTWRRPSWRGRYFVLLLVASVVIFMALSLAIGLQQSVWFDEAYSILLAKKPLAELLHLTAMDTHPPLYYIILKGWAALFGWSELALRSLSVLAAGGAVAVAGLLTRRLFGVRAALITLPFIVFAPFLLRYGFEIRMYALASLIGIAATYVLVTALGVVGRRRVALFAAYAVLVALGVYTLYYTALLWVAHVVWLVWLARKNKQPVFKSAWLLAYLGSVVLFLPWLPTFLSQISNGALTPVAQAMTLENLLSVVSFSLVYQPLWQLSPLVSLLVLAVLLLLGYFAVRAFKEVDKKRRPYLVLLALYTLVPVAVIALVSLKRPMYMERYLSHVLIGAMMFIGVAVAIATKKSSPAVHGLAALLFVALLVGVAHLAEVGNYNFQRLQKPTASQVAAALDCRAHPLVVVGSPYEATELSYYADGCNVMFLANEAEIHGGYLAVATKYERVRDASALSGKEFFYVYSGEPSSAIASQPFAWHDEKTFGAVRVVQITGR